MNVLNMVTSDLVDADEEAVGLHLWIDDPTFGSLSLQELLKFPPLLLEGGADYRLVQLNHHIEKIYILAISETQPGFVLISLV